MRGVVTMLLVAAAMIIASVHSSEAAAAVFSRSRSVNVQVNRGARVQRQVVVQRAAPVVVRQQRVIVQQVHPQAVIVQQHGACANGQCGNVGVSALFFGH